MRTCPAAPPDAKRLLARAFSCGLWAVVLATCGVQRPARQEPAGPEPAGLPAAPEPRGPAEPTLPFGRPLLLAFDILEIEGCTETTVRQHSTGELRLVLAIGGAGRASLEATVEDRSQPGIGRPRLPGDVSTSSWTVSMAWQVRWVSAGEGIRLSLVDQVCEPIDVSRAGPVVACADDARPVELDCRASAPTDLPAGVEPAEGLAEAAQVLRCVGRTPQAGATLVLEGELALAPAPGLRLARLSDRTLVPGAPIPR